MAVRMTERDLEALRVGITQQVEADTRAAMFREQVDRDTSKRHVHRVKLIEARDLEEGHAICSTSGYRLFRVEATVQRVYRETDARGGKLRPGTLWINYEHGGSALYLNDQVLVEDPAVANLVDKSRPRTQL